jgi:hypothetical protein
MYNIIDKGVINPDILQQTIVFSCQTDSPGITIINQVFFDDHLLTTVYKYSTAFGILHFKSSHGYSWKQVSVPAALCGGQPVQ